MTLAPEQITMLRAEVPTWAESYDRLPPDRQRVLFRYVLAGLKAALHEIDMRTPVQTQHLVPRSEPE